MKKILLPLLLAFFIGCSNDTENYVFGTANEQTSPRQKYKTFEADIECDPFGYAYFVKAAGHSHAYIPIFENTDMYGYAARRVKCSDITVTARKGMK